VRVDRLVDPGASGDATHDSPGCVTVETLTVRGEEDRTVGTLADGQVDRPGRAWRQRDRDDLAALAQDGQGPMAPLEPERFDVCAQRLGHPQPVDRQQRHQGMLGRPAQSGGHQQRADLVAIQPSRVRLVVQSRPADVGRR
jgi:hypothetical protein